METEGGTVEMNPKLLAIVGCLGLAATAWAGQGKNGRGIEIRSIAYATTAPLRSFPYTPSTWRPGTPPRVIPWRKPREAYKPGSGGSKPGGGGGSGAWSDPELQPPTKPDFSTTAAFQGQSFTGDIPPDTNLAVGTYTPTGETTPETQIVQLVNTSYAIYNTSGTPLAGGGDLGLTLFASLPSTANCSPNNPNSTTDGGDPVVLFDTLNNRWIISQLAYNSDFTQNDFCLAISDTADATGTYEAYDIPMGGDLPDYPKLAVWGNGIYFSANMFKLKVNPITGSISSTFLGAQACSFPLPNWTTAPSSITFTCSGSGNTAIYNILPADMDGASPAPPSSDGSDYYLQFVDNLSSTSGNELMLYQFQSGALVSLGALTVGTFHEACGGGTCVPQLGTSQQLDSLGDRLMYRLSYRNYTGAGKQQLAVNQSVQLTSKGNQTGIRWYELCSPSTGPLPFSVCGQGTFDPPDANYRWMGSIAQDSAGDLGLGYSESSGSIYPSIAVTGMEPGQGGMETEAMTYSGPNFQDTYSRWGDYSGMAVDPNDDCTFWYTNEYSTTTNLLGIYNIFWGTVIGSFHMGDCTSANSP